MSYHLSILFTTVRIACNADRCNNSYGLSVCLCVCLSVTFRCFVQTNEDTIVRFSASGRAILLVSEKVNFISNHSSVGVKVK